MKQKPPRRRSSRVRPTRARPAIRADRKATRVDRKAKKTARRPSRRSAPSKPVLRWNPDPEDVQRSVVKLVLSLVEFIRKLMERQAIRRMEQKTLTQEEVDRVGVALMQLEETVKEIADRFGLEAKDLNIDLGPVGKLH